MSERQVVLYGDVNLNIIDGSAIWLVSLAETLALTNSTVHVVLKAQVSTDRLLTRISDHPRIVVHPAVPTGGMAAMSLDDAAARLEDVITATGARILVVRGSAMAERATRSSLLSERLWSYVTDFPFPATLMPAEQLARLRRIAAGSQRLFLQTEDTRSYVEAIVPEAAGKCLLMNPTVPDDYFVAPRTDDVGEELRLVYSGKLHPEWRTLDMTALPALLGERDCPASLTVLGDKVQSADPEWITDMQETLEAPPVGVTWRGGVPREEALKAVAAHDVGLSWRSTAMDSSLELSTKVLEYAAAGTPPLLNRTAAHERLFGSDYPLFVSDDATDVTEVLVRARELVPGLRGRVQEAVRSYSSTATAERFEAYFARSEPELDTHPLRAAPVRVVIASHDLKFTGELVASLTARADVELRFDQWATLDDHDEELSRELLAWADVVLCEWAGPVAVWYSQRKRPGQRLLVRLHRFELTAPWITDVDIDAVDAVITVSEYYRQLTHETLGWPEDKVHCISNVVDLPDFDRPKVPGAEFALGLVGIVPFRKRPDRALDLLERLLDHDRRYRLHVKGRPPWEYPWTWRDWTERDPYLDFYDRVGSTPGLAERVVFEPFGADIANWMRRIGWVLSPSTDESFHLAPAEGMASGAVPLFWPRPGVETIFGPDHVFPDVDAMAEFVISLNADPGLKLSHQRAVREFARRFDPRAVERQWLELLLG
ncbi:glycosyltransferase family 4 protein [Tessaracoccus terricola]